MYMSYHLHTCQLYNITNSNAILDAFFQTKTPNLPIENTQTPPKQTFRDWKLREQVSYLPKIRKTKNGSTKYPEEAELQSKAQNPNTKSSWQAHLLPREAQAKEDKGPETAATKEGSPLSQ